MEGHISEFVVSEEMFLQNLFINHGRVYLKNCHGLIRMGGDRCVLRALCCGVTENLLHFFVTADGPKEKPGVQ